jgi:transcription-repair coupling factor (superfamily II helicase)
MSWNNLRMGAGALAVARAASAHPGLTLVVTRSTASAQRWLDELSFYAANIHLLHFPDWETLAYDVFSPHQDIISERLATLRSLPALSASVEPAMLVVPVQTLLQKIAPRTYLDGHSLLLATGQLFDIATERTRLAAAGYQAVETVAGRGEYAVRGSLMDIFPMGAEQPVRVDLLDNEIESLRTFDPETQRTIERINEMRLLPAKEFPLDPSSIARFRNNWHNTFNVDVRRCSVYQDVSEGIPPGGVEYYLPFFFPELNTLFDYLPASTLIVREAAAVTEAARYLEDVGARFENLRHDIERPIIEPKHLFVSEDELNGGMKPHAQIVINDDAKHSIEFGSRDIPDVQANPRLKDPASALNEFLDQSDVHTLFVADTAGRREVFHEFLARAGIRPADVADLHTFLDGEQQLGMTIAPIEQGLWLECLRVVTESEVFGHQVKERRAKSARALDPEQIIKNLTELHIGEAVVHIEHGIGRYLGLMTLEIDGNPNEFLTVEYAEAARLYVPVTSLHLISRYSGAEHAPLHRLGSDAWDKAKRRAAEKIHDVAAELLNIYARREVNLSFRFDEPGADYQRFVDQFPFEVTHDQQAAIDQVVADLCSERATDRLICGDVGFGKTEVAMRAAFVAVQSNKQVAVLVPTTLLAQQHLETFRDRFADWPVNIEVVSRLRTDGEVADVSSRLASANVDILIGTHKLLNPAMKFKDLGLVIIDEEHRFGVRQKERLRNLRAEVDVLTLTATPIPRTLNMAMSGMRDLSIIATPPAKRLSIKTFVQEKRNHVIKEAITRELMRGGQVFYLHNEVRTIEQVADELVEMVPEARIGVGHGQMPKRKLEAVMNDFYHRQLNLLVCTTIIETGIDIPNANTIIMERADKFGLAQLHQLRGRVGRSHRQAYAYLLTPHPKALNADAKKRLDAIEAAGELGVGFTLATMDMEIRGAGELLGDEQSGQIESVGFSLYMELLDRAVKDIQDGKTPDMGSPLEPISQEVNLHAPTLIPEPYLPDVHARLIAYKRIANATDETNLAELRVEMIDRFGLLPEPLRTLFHVTALKLKTQPLGILRLDLGDQGGRVEFSPQTTVDPLAVVKLVQSQPATYRLEGATMLRISRRLADFAARLTFAEELIDLLAPNSHTDELVANG